MRISYVSVPVEFELKAGLNWTCRCFSTIMKNNSLYMHTVVVHVMTIYLIASHIQAQN